MKLVTNFPKEQLDIYMNVINMHGLVGVLQIRKEAFDYKNRPLEGHCALWIIDRWRKDLSHFWATHRKLIANQ